MHDPSNIPWRLILAVLRPEYLKIDYFFNKETEKNNCNLKIYFKTNFNKTSRPVKFKVKCYFDSIQQVFYTIIGTWNYNAPGNDKCNVNQISISKSRTL